MRWFQIQEEKGEIRGLKRTKTKSVEEKGKDADNAASVDGSSSQLTELINSLELHGSKHE